MHRIPLEELSSDMLADHELSLTGPQAHHARVLRLGMGETVQVFDGQGQQAQAVVLGLDELQVRLRLLEPPSTDKSREYPQPVTLGVALLKGDKLADVVRAGTELGVGTFQLLVTDHADVRDIGQQKLIRLRRIASEAARQCGRAVTPSVLEPITLKKWALQGQVFLAHPGSEQLIGQLLHWQAPLTLLTGPEGGFSQAEVQYALDMGAQAVTLGPRILRAETAPVALLGALAALGK